MAHANFGSRHDVRSGCQLLEGPEAKCIPQRSSSRAVVPIRQKLPHAGRGKYCISQMRLNKLRRLRRLAPAIGSFGVYLAPMTEIR